MNKTIKLYRHLVQHIEYLRVGDPIITYRLTDWTNIKSYITGDNKKVVKIEEKEITIDE
jgi:hypothetical protein